jgi:gephyrin
MAQPVRTKSSYPLVSVEHAQSVILEETTDRAVEEVLLAECLGRTLAEDVTARDDLPPFPASIKARSW